MLTAAGHRRNLKTDFLPLWGSRPRHPDPWTSEGRVREAAMTVLVGCFIRPRIRDFVLADRPENPVSLTPSPSSRLNSRRSENIGFCDLHSCGCRWEPIPDGTLKSGCRAGQYAKCSMLN